MERGGRRQRRGLKLIDFKKGGYKNLRKTPGSGAVENNKGKQDLPTGTIACNDDAGHL